MLQREAPDDYVMATGETFSVRRFAEMVFSRLDLPLCWAGTGDSEQGVASASGRVLIRIDPRYFRPAEVDLLLGDPSKARRELGWQPKTSFQQLVNLMVDADLLLAERERRARG